MYGVENIRSDISGDASNFWQFHIMVWFIDQYLYFQIKQCNYRNRESIAKSYFLNLQYFGKGYC